MSNARFIAGVLIILLGLSALFDIPFFKIGFALLLVYIGVSILTGKRGCVSVQNVTEPENVFKKVLVFSAVQERVVSTNFQRAEIVAVFGGGEVDFRSAKTTASHISLEVVAIFGGLKVYVPPTWEVTTEGAGILGAMNNQTKHPVKGVTRVTVKGAAIFGGVDIVN